MKLRIEPQGLHYYCRKSGLHILLDEVNTTMLDFSIAPRTVSIAITDECDFSCSYCYVNLKDRYISKDLLIAYCKELDGLGTFDVALGGGEPTLHPDFITICNSIGMQTKLGISVTTHGHNLNEKMIDQIKESVSFIRVSIDGIEPIYSQLRKKPLSDLTPKLALLKNKIPFGINTVLNKLTIPNLNALRDFFLEQGASEWLLLPMWNKGKYMLNETDWTIIQNWILKNYKDIPIRISSDARLFLKLPYLFDTNEWYNDYGFIGIDNTFRINSFTQEHLNISDFKNFKDLFKAVKNRTEKT